MNSDHQFETIVNAHYEALYRFALSLTRTESDAKDLTQQTFYVWATKGHQLRDLSKVKTWLFTTMHRLFLESRRRQNRFIREDEADDAEPLPMPAAEPIDPLDCSDLLQSLAKVDEIYRAALALFYLEDYPYKDVAVILDVPIGTVKSRVARGITQLRQILRRDELRASARESSVPDCQPQECFLTQSLGIGCG